MGGISSPTNAVETGSILSWRMQAAAILCLAAFAHGLYWSTRPPDMSLFLEPWFAHIVRNGPIGAVAHPFSNYEPAYLYLLAAASTGHSLLVPMSIIKLLSVAGSLFLALAFADLLKTAGASPRLALFILVLPSVVINAALLGQCDALWAGCCLFALAAMMRGETVRSLAWCGVAFAFKSQAAFVAPVIMGAMIGRRAPWWQWGIPAAMFLITLIPAWLLGCPAWKLLNVCPDQAALVRMPGKLAKPWIAATIFANQSSRSYFVIGYAAAVAAALAVTALATRRFGDRQAMLLLALLSATALPFLLPKMLERYYFLGDVLALALALSLRTRLAVLVALAVQLASLFSLLTYIYWFHWPYPALLGTLCAAGGLTMIWMLVWRDGANSRAIPTVEVGRRTEAPRLINNCDGRPHPALVERTIA
jgi:Gpi18-like mannosyltransferase